MYLVFDIGGTISKYAIIDENFTFHLHQTIPTIAEGNSILKWMKTKVNELSNYNIKGIAIASGGVIDPYKGQIIYANPNIVNYTGLNLKYELEKEFKIRTTIENDVNCFGLAEAKYHKDFLILTIGTGIGGAIIINNKIYRGHSYRAGEFGQMIINDNSFENQASVTALVNLARQKALDVNSGIDVFNLYDTNNPHAKIAVENFFHHLATGILNLGYVFNPPTIILGGGITSRLKFLDELTEYINSLKDKNYFDQTIKIAKHNNDGGLVGALVHHLQESSY